MRQIIKLNNQILRFSFACVFLFFYANAFCQIANPDVPKINIPTSPEAAMIGRFGDIPVGYYTGTANISVPLYTIKEGLVEIPISLNYHSSGIKVDDQATWVGLGWDLSPEGTIIQEVRGLDDDNALDAECQGDPLYDLFKQRFANLQDNSYMFLPQLGRVTAPNFCSGYSTVGVDLPTGFPNDYEDPYCVIDKLLHGMAQPDIYNYSFNGHSGKFYIHPHTHEIVVIDKNDQVYFQKTNSSLITATTLDGTIYSFGSIETAHGGIEGEYTGKTYKLTNITLLTGKSISFTYTDNLYTERSVNQMADINLFGTGFPVNTNSDFTNHTKKTLTRITSTDAIVDFNLSARDDINILPTDNLQKLSSIDITSRLSNIKIKTIQFNYSYFPYDYSGVVSDAFINAHTDALGKRLKLDAVKELGYDDSGLPVSSKPPYQFEYDLSVTMPLKVSFAKDFWGYYNGEYNTLLLPDLEYFDYFYKPEYKAINQTLSYPYTGAKRFTDNTKAGAYLLKKITYPTGGFTEFGYEPNSFTNQFIPDKSMNIFKSYSVEDNSLGGTYSTLFKLSRATDIRFENHINNGAGNYNGVPPLTYSQMAGCYISFSKIKMVNGSPEITLLKQWDLSTVLNADFQNDGGKAWTETLRVEFDPDPNPTFNYQLKVVFPDELNNVLYASIAGVTSHITFYDETGVNTSESKQCGMRVSAIKSYTEAGKIASDKLVKYYDGKLLNAFRPLTVYKASNLDVSGVSNGNGYEYIAFYKKITVSGNDFGTNGGNLIGYGKVEEFELAGGVATTGKKVNYYLNVENKTQQGCPFIPNLRNGFISKEQVFDNSNVEVLEKNYNYSYLQPFPPKYVGINIVRLSTGSKVPCGNITNPSSYTTQYYENNGIYPSSLYGYNAYTINAEWSKLQSVTTTQFSGGTSLITTESYTYNTEGSIKTTSIVNSKAETLTTKYFYPTDNLINPYPDDYMTTVHNTGTPVITEKYNGTTLLSRQRTFYGSVADAPTLMPQYIYSQKGSNPEEKLVTINSYDDKGNITQYTEENNIPISFVWNADKTLPIAKIENATYFSLLALPNGLNSDFRTSLPNARVTSFTYKPLTGVKTITDINNKTFSHEYDAFGRIMLIRDNNNNIVKKFCYNYAGQAEDCGN